MKVLSFKRNELNTNVEIFEYPSGFRGSININVNTNMSRDYIGWGSNVKVTTAGSVVRVESNGEGTNYGATHGTFDRSITYKKGTSYYVSLEVRGNISTLDYNYLMRTETGNNGMGNINGITTNWKRFTIRKDTDNWSTRTGYLLFGSRQVGKGNWFEFRNVKISENIDDDFFTHNPSELGLSIPEGVSRYVPTITKDFAFTPEIVEGVGKVSFTLDNISLREIKEVEKVG